MLNKNQVQQFIDSNKSYFKFEVRYSKSCVARIYLNNVPTCFKAGGYGYDKENAVICEFMEFMCKGLNTAHVGSFRTLRDVLHKNTEYLLKKIHSSSVCDLYYIHHKDLPDAMDRISIAE